MNLKKYYKFTGYVFYAVAIFLSLPFTVAIVLSSLILVLEPDKLGWFDYLLFVGEMFVKEWHLRVFSIALIISGFALNKKLIN